MCILYIQHCLGDDSENDEDEPSSKPYKSKKLFKEEKLKHTNPSQARKSNRKLNMYILIVVIC